MTDRPVDDRVGAQSAAVAAFASGGSWDALPAAVRDAALALTAAAVSQARSAAGDPGTEAVTRYVAALQSPAEATVLIVPGGGLRVAATYAALANGTAARVAAGSGTATPPLACSLATAVVPAAVALGEATGADLPDVLAAVAVGLEVGLRLTAALGAGHVERGWDPVGTAGHVGACMAASRVARLDAGQARHALGYAATEAAGVHQPLGNSVAGLVAGKAAADGVEAARLAEAGLTGPAAPLEGRRGLLALETTHADLAALTDGLGATWLLAEAEGTADGRWAGVVAALPGGATPLAALLGVEKDAGRP